jgi:hypothetical protein
VGISEPRRTISGSSNNQVSERMNRGNKMKKKMKENNE